MKQPPASATFEDYLAERNLGGVRLGCWLVVALMPAGLALDWLIHPEWLPTFLWIRACAAVVGVLLALATYLPRAIDHTYPLALGGGLVGAGSMAWMLAHLGWGSPYYAGLNLVILAMGLLFHWTAAQAAIACALVVGVWLVPTSLHAHELELASFANNLYFLAVTASISVTSNVLRYRQARRTFSAQSQLASTSEKLAEALERLQIQERAKNEFFANLSHELRTPLTLILTPVEQALEGRGPPQEEVWISVRNNAHRLLRLIDDLLDLSRIDAGQLRLRVRQVDLPHLVTKAIDAFQASAHSLGVHLAYEQGPDGPDLHGDAHRLEMILTNLLSNAMKVTSKGGTIRIATWVQGGWAHVSVADRGPGIPAEEGARIFERFYRREAQARTVGAGIGLALAKELAELHGGRLAYESPAGEGTTFTLSLPLGDAHFRQEVLERRQVAHAFPGGRRSTDAPADPTLPPQPSPLPPPSAEAAEPILLEGGRKPRIVLVEDNEAIRTLIQGILLPTYEVELASDGEEGLAKILAAPPDLVISDVMLPGISGTELCRRVKTDPALETTPVILLTARSGSDAVLEGYAHGADDFVVKPIHPRILLARIHAQLRIRTLGLELIEHARLAAVGTLAAGVGHEVRNPLNALLNGTLTLLEREGLDPTSKRVLSVMEEAARRIDEISAALVNHAQPGENQERRPVDLREGLEATLRLLEHRSRDLAVHRDYAASRRVVGAAGPLNQVFLNLLDNAIRSAASNVWIRTVEGAGHVTVAVEDDGPGVSHQLVGRLFDPFFTTREPGEGTGLGLYLSSRIVHNHGGFLRYDPRPGGGASFSVDLPWEAPP